MAKQPRYAAELKDDRLDLITSKLGSGALIKLYTGTKPTNPDTAVTDQTLIAELECGAAFAGAASGGVLTASAIDPVAAIAESTDEDPITWFRITESDDTPWIDGTVGKSPATDFDMILQNTTVNTGQQITVTSLIINHGN